MFSMRAKLGIFRWLTRADIDPGLPGDFALSSVRPSCISGAIEVKHLF
jgi:hypothetical protein